MDEKKITNPVGRPRFIISEENKRQIIEKLNMGIKKKRIMNDYNISYYILKNILTSAATQ